MTAAAPVPVQLDGVELWVRAGETVLQACRRSAIEIPFSCQAGSCHSCLLRCLAGPVPEAAQQGLALALRQQAYLLACQCQPTAPMQLSRPPAAGPVTPCVLLSLSGRAGPFPSLVFSSARPLHGLPGQRLRLLTPSGPPLWLLLTECSPDGERMSAVLQASPEAQLPPWLARADGDGDEFGHGFAVCGPVDAVDAVEREQEGRPEGVTEADTPTPDPALWAELGQGSQVRAVLEDFYAQVYADALLKPFFQKVTRDRAIDKQYAFLKQLMTGERAYFGDRPRNAHHWMVISPELFAHRQALMAATLEKHGVSPPQRARWMRLELHYLPDIVKSTAWPRWVDGVAQPLDGYGRELLSAATLCDHCGVELDAGTSVSYHLRLGQVSCASCTQPGPPPGLVHAGARDAQP